MKRLFKAVIRFYQKAVSPFTQPHCVYVPTCSCYALEALECFGAFRGGLLAVWRVLRCNPFSKGGYDPVPEKFTLRRIYKVYPRKEKRPKRRKNG
jgi:putative membrane protein insertion efficiency factor